jgi:hypothetical protein
VNFLAISTLPAERLVEILRAGDRRTVSKRRRTLGINQLDGRAVEPYHPARSS